ncbi:hypothetical protein IU501_25580 [Nocardia otitidiscaviarum]|uniref:Ribbon-helix-helix protein, CopG family n=1 Tax=Nocardia otitidiscaviarum TaxID=1823 RepID=A0A379JJ30_9NOCA|nr:hypothetical protein [Nocardia otitidiscaviarum]MBF6136362.1 hypothetical protein [Nocardia otitidiscaviarum]MBF6241387.1 hypothetical protein [Nocardia otitidiscaviarum]MBF6484564.1 hypothetical protein [Nocardia otitidiscaviarum]SUD48582.1 Uncharacterised protein [Nocardia otitidiscaviarum]
MTDPFHEMSPAEVAAIKDRLELTGETVTEKELGITIGPDAEPVFVPRSIKMPYDLDRACKARATALGMSQSAYIRSLIENDIATAGVGKQRPAWVRELLAVIAHHENDDSRKAS